MLLTSSIPEENVYLEIYSWKKNINSLILLDFVKRNMNGWTGNFSCDASIIKRYITLVIYTTFHTTDIHLFCAYA